MPEDTPQERYRQKFRRTADSAGVVADAAHGTITGYGTHGCRCDDCRQAWREYMAAQRAQRRASTAVARGILK